MVKQHPECLICKESFLTKIDLKDHIKKKHSTSSAKIAKVVSKNEKAGGQLSQPFQTKKNLSCDNCSLTSYSDRYLWMHKEKHHITDPTN